jgi:hypothetical protein
VARKKVAVNLHQQSVASKVTTLAVPSRFHVTRVTLLNSLVQGKFLGHSHYYVHEITSPSNI